MDDPFRSTITALWTRLGLGAPRFSEPGRVQLRVEAISLDLRDDGRGRLIIEGAVGPLPESRMERAQQTRRVLETNLGFLLDGEAGIYVRSPAGGETVLAVRASYPYALGSLDRLVKKIEDSLQVIEYYLAEFKATAAVRGTPRMRAETDGFDEAVIFRP